MKAMLLMLYILSGNGIKLKSVPADRPMNAWPAGDIADRRLLNTQLVAKSGTSRPKPVQPIDKCL